MESNNKKALRSAVTALLLIVCFSAPASASGKERFKDGLKTALSSPMQILSHMSEEYKQADFKPFGLAEGAARGLAYFAKDAMTGVIKMFTFYVDAEDDVGQEHSI